MCGEYHSDGEIPLSRIRFTPTCVGSTVWGAAFQEPLVGSPPHVWGVLEKQRRGSHRLRFTPTCVGSTRSAPFRPTRRAVHPHMCGEYSSMSHRFAAYAGSPPHVWGVHFAKRLRYRSHRGSPPHVWGVLRAWFRDRRRATVHPHMCGEYSYPCHGPNRRARFTPTCVGSTIIYSVLPIFLPVHPHMCGEYYFVVILIADNHRFTPTCVGSTHRLTPGG